MLPRVLEVRTLKLCGSIVWKIDMFTELLLEFLVLALTFSCCFCLFWSQFPTKDVFILFGLFVQDWLSNSFKFCSSMCFSKSYKYFFELTVLLAVLRLFNLILWCPTAVETFLVVYKGFILWSKNELESSCGWSISKEVLYLEVMPFTSSGCIWCVPNLTLPTYFYWEV